METKCREEEVPRVALFEGTIDDLIHEQENKNTRANTERGARLLKPFLQRKVDSRTPWFTNMAAVLNKQEFT